jgi:DNA-binding NarL/FixJ family response regulator
MGQRNDLSTNEKMAIVSMLANGKTTLEIAHLLHQNHRIVINYTGNASHKRI